MDSICLSKKSKAFGTVNLPGSKSLSNRALLLSALSSGSKVLKNLLKSDDTDRMIEALSALGVTAERHEDLSCRVERDLSQPLRSCDLFLGNAGTAMRPLTAVLAADGNEGHYVLTGEPRMYERPIKPLTDALTALGASIKFLGKEGFPPLEINGRKLHGGTVTIDGTVSSQFITGLLFALPFLPGDSVLRLIPPVESRSYLNLTIAALADAGIRPEMPDENTFVVSGNSAYQPEKAVVEGDYSNAAFFLGLNCIGGSVTVTGLRSESLQGDRVCEEYLPRLQAGAETLDISDCPDLAPVFFAVAALCHGATFTGTRRLRFKESDRGAAMAAELARFGIMLDLGENRITVPNGIPHAPDAPLSSHNDHRIAMALSLLCSRTGGEILGAEAVRKSFPDYWDRLRSLGIPVTLEP